MTRVTLSDGTSWPLPDADAAWRARYLEPANHGAAEINEAYAHILDPNVPFSQIEPQLRELRRAWREALK